MIEALRARPGVTTLFALATVLGAIAVGAWTSASDPARLQQRVDGRLRLAGGTPIALARVSPLLREAVVATEDERFYRHHGIDLIGVLRAIPYDVAHLSFAQGASTITEQVAKLIYLGGNDHSPWRKLEDGALALKLESRYDKEQILDAYLDSVYFGRGATGAYAASEGFFGVPPRRLDLTQASLLAGLIQAPSLYDPARHPQAARLRQLAVLRSLVRDGLVTQEEAADAVEAPLPIRGARPLPAAHGVDLAPGPAFVWWEFGAGAVALAAAVAGFLALRRVPIDATVRRVGVEVALGLALLAGVATIVRSFRAL